MKSRADLSGGALLTCVPFLSVGVVGRGFGAQTPATICIPQAIGVPALSGPPRWWDADGDQVIPEIPNGNDPPELVSFFDPRWQGAVSNTDAAADHVEFKALYNRDTVYLSWEVKVDRRLDPGADAVWFGIKQTDGSAVVIKLTLNTSLQGTLEAVPRPGLTISAYLAEVWKYDGTSWSPVIPTSSTWPTWLPNQTR